MTILNAFVTLMAFGMVVLLVYGIAGLVMFLNKIMCNGDKNDRI